MNVFFMDYRYVSKDAWKYIVQVLKIKKTFCFFESSICPLNISNAIYKGEDTDITSFGNYIVFNLADEIAPRSRKADGTMSRIDKNLFLQSNSRTPRKNLLSTDNPNFLVLGKVFDKQFEDYCNGIREGDIGLHIANFLFNLLNKQTGNNDYPNRISFLLLDYVRMQEYGRFAGYWDEWLRLSTFYYDKDGTCKKIISFYKLILKLLNEQFPKSFPLRQIDDKKLYSSFIDMDNEEYKSAKQQWEWQKQEREQEERRAREWEQDGRDSQREIDEMNRDFWKECGDAGSNCESWPGWD